MIYTDSETWAGDVHPAQALRDYRAGVGHRRPAGGGRNGLERLLDRGSGRSGDARRRRLRHGDAAAHLRLRPRRPLTGASGSAGASSAGRTRRGRPGGAPAPRTSAGVAEQARRTGLRSRGLRAMGVRLPPPAPFASTRTRRRSRRWPARSATGLGAARDPWSARCWKSTVWAASPSRTENGLSGPCSACTVRATSSADESCSGAVEPFEERRCTSRGFEPGGRGSTLSRTGRCRGFARASGFGLRPHHASVAQRIEHRASNPGRGSTPLGGLTRHRGRGARLQSATRRFESARCLRDDRMKGGRR